MITRLQLKNFGPFSDLSIDFGSKINIIIGENGCGKTQLLKAAYVLTDVGKNLYKQELDSKSVANLKLTQKLISIYKPNQNKVGGLAHRGCKEKSELSAETTTGHYFGASFTSRANKVELIGNYETPDTSLGIFIPTKESLSFLDGIANNESDKSTLYRLFDSTYLDLAERLLNSNNLHEEKSQWLMESIVNRIGGRFEFEGTQVQFKAGVYKEHKNKKNTFSSYFAPTADKGFSMTMTAEGFRKIGVLQRLIENGFVGTGINGPLFWDEPESNMNPQLMKLLVETLLELSRNGQQIILATHDYVLLKWFDLLMNKDEDDHVRFHYLYRDTISNVVKLESTEEFSLMDKNAISDTFAELYDADVKRALER